MTDNRLSVEAVMSAMAQFASAQADEERARAEYDGYSWDYHGHSYIEAVSKAREAAEKMLNDYVTAVAEAAVARALRAAKELEHDG